MEVYILQLQEKRLRDWKFLHVTLSGFGVVVRGFRRNDGDIFFKNPIGISDINIFYANKVIAKTGYVSTMKVKVFLSKAFE